MMNNTPCTSVAYNSAKNQLQSVVNRRKPKISCLTTGVRQQCAIKLLLQSANSFLLNLLKYNYILKQLKCN